VNDAKQRDPFSQQISAALRSAREAKGLTQVQVAEQAGLSHSFIRLVETGKSDISLARLQKWIGVLGMTIADLVPEPQHSLQVQVWTPSQWESNIVVLDKGVTFALMTPGRNKKIETGMYVLMPGAGMSAPLVHHGEESLYVVEGTIVLEVDGTVRVMHTGDVAYYSSDLPHILRNGSAYLPAQALSTTTHPSITDFPSYD